MLVAIWWREEALGAVLAGFGAGSLSVASWLLSRRPLRLKLSAADLLLSKKNSGELQEGPPQASITFNMLNASHNEADPCFLNVSLTTVKGLENLPWTYYARSHSLTLNFPPGIGFQLTGDRDEPVDDGVPRFPIRAGARIPVDLSLTPGHAPLPDGCGVLRLRIHTHSGRYRLRLWLDAGAAQAEAIRPWHVVRHLKEAFWGFRRVPNVWDRVKETQNGE